MPHNALPDGILPGGPLPGRRAVCRGLAGLAGCGLGAAALTPGPAGAASWASGANALHIVVIKSARQLMLVRAGAGSILWFSGLGYGARLLSPVLARQRAWQVLDVLSCLTLRTSAGQRVRG